MKSLFLPEWNAFIRYHELAGKQPTCVYLPGMMMPSLAVFLSTVAHPKMAGLHALLIDYLSSGFSEHPKDFDHSIENHARTVAAILDKEGIKDCTIIGQSMGGTVGIMLAILRPELVSRLIVAEGNLVPTTRGVVSAKIASVSENDYVTVEYHNFMQEMRAAALDGKPYGEFFLEQWGMSDPIGLHRAAVALVNLDPTLIDKFYQMSIPRTYIYSEQALSEHDVLVLEKTSPDDMKQHGIQVPIVPNAGHGMMFDNLTGFVDVLVSTLKIAS